jgi:hypothetical protein
MTLYLLYAEVKHPFGARNEAFVKVMRPFDEIEPDPDP